MPAARVVKHGRRRVALKEPYFHRSFRPCQTCARLLQVRHRLLSLRGDRLLVDVDGRAKALDADGSREFDDAHQMQRAPRRGGKILRVRQRPLRRRRSVQ